MTTLENLNNIKQSFLPHNVGSNTHCDVSEPSIEPAKEITQTQLKSLMKPIFQISEYNHPDTTTTTPITNSNTIILTNTKKHALTQKTELTSSPKKQKKNEELSPTQSEDSSKSNITSSNGKNFSRIVSTEMKKNSPKIPNSPQGSPPRAGSPTNITTVVATSVSHTCSTPTPTECLKKKKRKELDKPTIQETTTTLKKPYASKSSDKLNSTIPMYDKICLRVCGLNKGKYEGNFETHSFPITATIEDLQSLIEKSRCNENEKISNVVRTIWNNDMMIPKKIEPNTLLNDSHNSTWELQLHANQIVLNRIA